jgi:hypothetical protein
MSILRNIQILCRKAEHLLFPATQKKLKVSACSTSESLRLQLLNDKKFIDETRLEPYGFKVYSQNDEDGIIQEIFNRIGTTNKIFVEFGAYDGLENNTTYLLMQGWKGLWMDGDHKKMKVLKRTYQKAIDRKQLYAECVFITKDNINDLIGKYFDGEIDLLSVDIDGNDYYVWENINVINPRVVVVEYNAKFPPPVFYRMEYNATHQWDGSDIMGMSLQAAVELGDKKGYQLAGTNINGINAFFVRKDCIKNSQMFAEPSTAEHLYNPARYYMVFEGGHLAKHFLG